MRECFGCNQLNVDPEDVPRYDVLSPSFNPEDDMSTVGPYCSECWPSTYTGSTTPE